MPRDRPTLPVILTGLCATQIIAWAPNYGVFLVLTGFGVLAVAALTFSLPGRRPSAARPQ